MKPLTFILLSISLAHVARGQKDSLDMVKTEKAFQKLDRTRNLYQFRAYSLSFGLTPYTSIVGGSSPSIFGLFDIELDDRLFALDVLNNGSIEEHIGIGFLPFQGTKLHLGADIELLPQTRRVNLFTGIQYSLGLPQSSSPDDNSSIYLGWHQYAEPYIGIDYWPGKLDLWTVSNKKELDEYENPRFNQLFYARLQIGYSFLLSRLVVDSSGSFDPHLYQTVRRNTGNTLAIKISIGIDIPSRHSKLRKYDKYLYKQYHLSY